MDTLVLKHGVCYGQTVSNREILQQDTNLVQIRDPPNPPPPGSTVAAHMSAKLSNKMIVSGVGTPFSLLPRNAIRMPFTLLGCSVYKHWQADDN